MQKPDFLKGRKGITFVDLFAGAGGFSEGFMQAYTDKNYYDFSDFICTFPLQIKYSILARDKQKWIWHHRCVWQACHLDGRRIR